MSLSSTHTSNSNIALLGYEFRVALKQNRHLVLKLFENRQVQPTDHVIRFVSPFTLKTPIDPRDVSLLHDILDPNKTNFVTLKRIRELVITHEDISDASGGNGFGGGDGVSASLTLVSTAKQQQQQRWIPPKRAPPTSNASLYAASNALSIVPPQASSNDPDMLAIMTAISWSGKHLSQPSSLDRRLASTPLSRYATPLSHYIIPNQREDVHFPLLAEALKRIISDQDRGWSAAAIVATHVRSEVVFREMVRAEVPDILVPEEILHAFLSTPRWFRAQILDSTKTAGRAPHEMFRSLTAVRLPLAVTALRVEMDSASRRVMNAFLPQDILGPWARSSEKERSAFVTALLDLDCWDDDFIASLGGLGLESVLLSRQLPALGGPSQAGSGGQLGATALVVRNDERQIRLQLENIMGRIEEITNIATGPIRPIPSTDSYEQHPGDDSSLNGQIEEEKRSNPASFEVDLSNSEEDGAIMALKAKISTLHEELLL